MPTLHSHAGLPGLARRPSTTCNAHGLLLLLLQEVPACLPAAQERPLGHFIAAEQETRFRVRVREETEKEENRK